MKITVRIFCTIIAMSAFGADQKPDLLERSDISVVKLRVADVQELTADYVKRTGFKTYFIDMKPPVFCVVYSIEDVLRGEKKIIGQQAFGLTCDRTLIGNTHAITPRLKVGDKVLHAVARADDHILRVVSNVYGSPVDGGHLPSIQGRDSSYEVILQRLIQRRDHPETNKAAEIKAGPVAEPPPATTPQAKPPPSAVPKPAAPKRAEESHLGLWVTGTVVTLTACFFLLRKRR